MLSFFKNILNFNEKEVKRLKKKVAEINSLEEKVKKLKNADFSKETARLKKEIDFEEENLERVLPYAFALVREAANRVLGERHYDVQLMAGMVLHEGKIAEQKTGEGKTLSATLALYLNALLGRGTHLVTVNDYLARRDAGWMGAVYSFLGLSCSAIISGKSFIYDSNYLDSEATDDRLRHLKPTDRKHAYLADITYGINSEFGFDYLRDNMVFDKQELVQRDFYFAVVDEVDSVLIDEARTPHIISAPFEQDVNQYYRYAQIVERLMMDTDYVIDLKTRTANLTEHGIEKVERILGVDNIYESNYDALFHIEAALKAKTLFKKNKDYIVRGNEVVIVDEFTGRLLEGRRFSEGLHQAIEAKENVSIQKESKTLATISLQNYFRKYEKLAGMTGTAATEAEELHKIYKTDVIVLPTNKPQIRQDHPDYIYKTERGKFTALVEEIATEHKKGRPILVGTTSIEKNENLSALLRKKGIKHELLNAKNHEREAQIIAEAGKKGAVTIATNMAGRGVDIILGGAPPSKSQEANFLPALKSSVKKDKVFSQMDEQWSKEYKQWQKDHHEVVSLGGLYVIGTERHESRRIDNQLRGRSGRQGDPGDTRFFISLEDEMLRIFGGEQIGKMMTFLNFPENQPIEHAMVSKAIEQAQVKVEGFNFDSRKHLLEFDDVLNKQRDIVYEQRRQIIQLTEMDNPDFDSFLAGQVDKLYVDFILPLQSTTETKMELGNFLETFFVLGEDEKKTLITLDAQELETNFKQNVDRILKDKADRFGKEVLRQGVRFLYLSTIDHYFTQHLTGIEDLREGINLRGYAQLDPLVEYKKESFKLFNNMLNGIRLDFFRRLLHLEIEPRMEMQNPNVSDASIHSDVKGRQFPTPKGVGQSSKLKREKDQDKKAKNMLRSPIDKKKLGRNDPCWCGSGKKYKKCHYPN